MSHKRIGEILLEKGLITEAQLRECLEEQRLTRDYVGIILLRKGFVTEENLLKSLADQFHIAYVSLSGQYIDWAVASRYVSRIGSKQTALPIMEDDMYVTVACADPLDVSLIGDLETAVMPKKLRLVLVSSQELKKALEECQRRSKSSLRRLLDKE
jgi:type IV pilus assembly protein PilB